MGDALFCGILRRTSTFPAIFFFSRISDPLVKEGVFHSGTEFLHSLEALTGEGGGSGSQWVGCRREGPGRLRERDEGMGGTLLLFWLKWADDG